MEKEIREILNDLYKIDPVLKNHESELANTIRNILLSRPDIKFDEAFAKNLRLRLINGNVKNTKSLIPFFPMKNLSYIFSGALMTLFLVGVVYFGSPFIGSRNLISFDPSVTATGSDRAFGDLYQETSTPAVGLGGGAEIGMENDSAVSEAAPQKTAPSTEIFAEESAPEAASTETNSAEISREAAPSVSDNSASATDETTTSLDTPAIAPDIYPPYPATNYNYEYIGDEITLDQNQVEVLKRTKSDKSSVEISKLLGRFDLGILDFDEFGKTYLQNFTVTEDRKYGYSIYVDFDNESVSVSQAWNQWPQCYDEACWQNQKQLRYEDIPDDETLIQIAEEFLEKYGIDSSGYGKPFVNKYFQADYLMSQKMGFEFYVPESVTVTYPFIINDKQIHYDAGNPMGLDISVNIREMKVSGAWNMGSKNYQSSNYEAEVDVEKILAVAADGGWIPYYYEDFANSETATLQIGTPVQSYMQYWVYKDGINEEYLIPALVFPILEKPQDDYFYKNYVVVPLTKELLSQHKKNNDGGPIRIMEDGQ